MAAFNYTATRGLSLLGDEKGAWMADTTAETLVGSELVVDGNMSSSTNWSEGSGWTIGSGIATAVTASSNLIPIADSTTVIGKTYIATVNILSITAGSVSLAAFNGATNDGIVNFTTAGIKQISFVATTTGTKAYLVGSGFSGTIDDITMRLAVPDLSSNENGLGVYGSIAKTAVATGADLMAYSGFGTSDYLEQPYNSDLDVGTGDIGFHASFKRAAGISSAEYFFDRNDSGGSGPRTYLLMASDGTIDFHINGTTLSTTTTYDDGEWHSLWGIRISGVGYIFIDGVLIVSVAMTATVTNAAALLSVGIGYSHTSPFLGSLALGKATAAPPTATQTKAIYNKEKHLFLKYSYYTQEGIAYDLDIVLSVANKSVSTRKNTTVTLSGKTRAIVHREDTEWSITTDLLHRTDTSYVRVSEMEEFLYSTHGSEAFTMDLYGTSASPDELKSCIRVGSDGGFPRVAEQMLFRTSFKVQET